jgi:integrase
MAEIKHSVKRDMVEFAFNTGWRISEITGPKWVDVKLEKVTAWIVDPKNTESVEVELNDRALEILSDQEKRSDFVFCHKNGKQYKTGLHTAFKNAASRAGFYLPPRKTWHILRRT